MRKPPKRPPRTARQMTQQLDESLAQIRTVPRPVVGWVRSIREALSMTQLQLAKRMGVTRGAISKLEADEVAGKITMGRLQRVAVALGCELEYQLIPQTSLKETISQQALQRAKTKLYRVNATQALEASAVSSTTLSFQVKELADELDSQRATDLWDGG